MTVQDWTSVLKRSNIPISVLFLECYSEWKLQYICRPCPCLSNNLCYPAKATSVFASELCRLGCSFARCWVGSRCRHKMSPKQQPQDHSVRKIFWALCSCQAPPTRWPYESNGPLYVLKYIISWTYLLSWIGIVHFDISITAAHDDIVLHCYACHFCVKTGNVSKFLSITNS